MSARPRVLIIEDNPQLLLLARLELEAAGCVTSLAADGATGLRRIEAERPDAVVLDLALPGLDGWDVLYELHGLAHAPAVVVCSGKGGVDDKRRAFDWGASAYVEKPFEFEELVREVLRAVERARTHEAVATATSNLPLPLADPELA